MFHQWYASYLNYCALKRRFLSAGIWESTELDESPGLGRPEHVMFGFGPGSSVFQIVKNKAYMEYFGHFCVIRFRKPWLYSWQCSSVTTKRVKDVAVWSVRWYNNVEPVLAVTVLINYNVCAKPHAATKRLRELSLGSEINVVSWVFKYCISAWVWEIVSARQRTELSPTWFYLDLPRFLLSEIVRDGIKGVQ